MRWRDVPSLTIGVGSVGYLWVTEPELVGRMLLVMLVASLLMLSVVGLTRWAERRAKRQKTQKPGVAPGPREELRNSFDTGTLTMPSQVTQADVTAALTIDGYAQLLRAEGDAILARRGVEIRANVMQKIVEADR